MAGRPLEHLEPLVHVEHLEEIAHCHAHKGRQRDALQEEEVGRALGREIAVGVDHTDEEVVAQHDLREERDDDRRVGYH